jgi:hypothetical protein
MLAQLGIIPDLIKWGEPLDCPELKRNVIGALDSLIRSDKSILGTKKPIHIYIPEGKFLAKYLTTEVGRKTRVTPIDAETFYKKNMLGIINILREAEPSQDLNYLLGSTREKTSLTNEDVKKAIAFCLMLDYAKAVENGNLRHVMAGGGSMDLKGRKEFTMHSIEVFSNIIQLLIDVPPNQ